MERYKLKKDRTIVLKKKSVSKPNPLVDGIITVCLPFVNTFWKIILSFFLKWKNRRQEACCKGENKTEKKQDKRGNTAEKQDKREDAQQKNRTREGT